MISVEAQQKLLLTIAQKLAKPLTVYAIGGTAMMFHGIKDATLDIDLVFETAEDREAFKKVITAIGYKHMNAIQVYGGKKDPPQMFTLGNERFDLFVNDVIDFTFSKAMQKRAQTTHQFGDNLLLKIADPHDLILMKCATDRLKDKDDGRKIIESKPIQWNILIEEAKNQVTLGRDRALFDLGDFLEHLKREMNVPVPQNILDTLFTLVQEQITERQKENKK
jgi:hypothetical protein